MVLNSNMKSAFVWAIQNACIEYKVSINQFHHRLLWNCATESTELATSVCIQTKANWSPQSLFYRNGDKPWSQGREFLLENCAVGEFAPDYRTVPRIFANAICTECNSREEGEIEMGVSHKFHPWPSWKSRAGNRLRAADERVAYASPNSQDGLRDRESSGFREYKARAGSSFFVSWLEFIAANLILIFILREIESKVFHSRAFY